MLEQVTARIEASWVVQLMHVSALMAQVSSVGNQVGFSTSFAGLLSGYFGVPSLVDQPFNKEDCGVS